MGAEIIHDNDVARLQHRHELLLDIGSEALPIDRPDEHQPPRVEPGLPGSPALTPARDVGAGLLNGEQGFF